MTLHSGRGRIGGSGASIRSQTSLILRPRGFTKKKIDLFRNSRGLRNAITVVCAVEHKEIHNFLSVRRVTADEDPFLFQRISDQDPEGFPLTYPAWRRNSLNKKITQRQARGSNG